MQTIRSAALNGSTEEGAPLDVLLFVEDPGAANFVALLPDALSKAGLEHTVVAVGPAADQLSHLQCAFRTKKDGLRPDDVLVPLRPRVVVVGTSENPDAIGLEIIATSRQLKIPTIGFIDGPANEKYRFRGNGSEPLEFAPDWLLVADSSTKTTYANLGFPTVRIIVCGHPHYDYVRRERDRLQAVGEAVLREKLLPSAPEGRPILLFAAERSTGLADSQFTRSGEYTLAGRGGSDRRTDIVLEEVLDACATLNPAPYFVLRLHPKNDPEEFSPYLGEIDAISCGGLALEIIAACDAVVGLTSILLTEAALMGRPTLSVLPRSQERRWLTPISQHVTPIVNCREDIPSALEGVLARSTFDPAELDKIAPLGAAERVASVVSNVLECRQLHRTENGGAIA